MKGRCQNRGDVVTPGSVWGQPAYRPGGIRHEGGVTAIQALVWNVGTCRSDAKGEVRVGGPHKDESTDAERRGGAVRSRDEGPVMGLDRRGCIVRPCSERAYPVNADTHYM